MKTVTKITKPSFALGYWKPFDENTNYYESYQLYIRDTSLQKYNAQIVGSYIQSATNETVDAIKNTAIRLGHKLEDSNIQLKDISFGVKSLVYGMRLQIEQQKATNLLLHDIKKLMRLPDSERERIYAIELGLKFFSNAKKDKDLFNDALIEFQKAETIMNQDYFVLHKIGLIHLLVEEHLDIAKAKEYFKKAAKYSSVESNGAIHSLAYLNNDHEVYDNINTNSTLTNSKEIKIMASESYEKAAFAAYILGEIVEARELQSKALKLNASAQNRFFMGKYLIRGGQIETGIDHLNRGVELLPEILDLIITDLDLNTNIRVLEWIKAKVDTINNQIDYLKHQWKISKNDEKSSIISTLQASLTLKYFERIHIYTTFSTKFSQYNTSEKIAINNLKNIIEAVNNHEFFSIDTNQKIELLSTLKNALNKSSAETINKLNQNTTLIISNDKRERIAYYNNKASKDAKEAEENAKIMKWVIGTIIYLVISATICSNSDISFGYSLLWGPVLLVLILIIGAK